MIGKRLRELREKRGWSIQDVADRLHIAKSTYAGYEYDRRDVPNELLPTIADLFNVTTDYLLGRSMEPKLSEIEDVERSEDLFLKLIDDFRNGRVEGYSKERQARIAESMELQLHAHKKEQEEKKGKIE